ncbi:MAG: nitroreductase family protein [Methanobacteriaceae archaeon]|nr:nitroreductase family protein [Methanobacteriaceae archaeon]
MDHNQLYHAIFRRKSVRRYNPSPLDEKDLMEIENLLGKLEPLYPEIKTKFKVVSTEMIKTRMMKKAPHYLLAFSEKKEGYLENVGFMLQQMDLYLSQWGFGTCWQGIPKPRKEVLESSFLNYVILLTMGKPQEALHRDITEFKRKNIEGITDLSDGLGLLEPVRLAPSSTNSQPWYFTGDNRLIHAYCRKSNALKAILVKKFNQIDLGIALYHLKLAADHQGKSVEFTVNNEAENNPPDGYYYVMSVKVNS